MESQFQKMLNLLDHMPPWSTVGFVTAYSPHTFKGDMFEWCKMFGLPIKIYPQHDKVKLGDRYIHFMPPSYREIISRTQGREFKDFFVSNAVNLDAESRAYLCTRLRAPYDPLYILGRNFLDL